MASRPTKPLKTRRLAGEMVLGIGLAKKEGQPREGVFTR
jgi:hypothetical protein